MTEKVKAKKILVIEDEGDMCLILDLLLNGKETMVDHVKTLAEARDFLEREQPSLVLLDNRLPDGFGLDLISFIKTNYPNIKIIMISGVDMAAGDVALEIGADIFLPKPFTKAQLNESVSHLLN